MNSGVGMIEAAARGDLVEVEVLLKAGVSPDVSDEARLTPLHAAVFGGHVDVVRALLAGGANPNILGANGATPLFYAIDFGFVKVAQVLKEYGAWDVE